MNKNFGKTLILFLIIIIFSFIVLAAPPVATFWGRINVSGVQYNESAVLDAYINSVIVANVYAGEFTADYYHIDVPCDEADNVTFKIWGLAVDQVGQLCSQGSRTELNLTATKLANGVACSYSAACSGGYCCSGATIINGSGSGTCQASVCAAATTPPATGGSSPSGGGAATVTEECSEQWSCTAYTPCSDGKQTRTCTDTNSCGTTESKPIEERNCVVREEEEEDEKPAIDEDAEPPTEEGSQVGQVQVNDNVNWVWTGTEWVQEGTAKYEEIAIRAPLFGKLETVWLYVFIGVIVIAIAIVVIEIKRKHRF